MLKDLVRAILPNRARQALQRWRLSWKMARFQKRIVRHRFGDGELTLELGDGLACGWYDRDWPLPPEIELLRKSKLRPGSTVFDLGAHQGVVALMLAREVGAQGKVIAVEAVAHNAAAAVRNRDLNSMSWIEVIPAAVASSDGVLRINQSLNSQVASASDYAGTVSVPAISIDTLSDRYGRPDVVYLDIEGMELAALHGARKTLTAYPDVFVEVHTKHGLEATGGSVEAVLAHFPQSDYATFVHSETLRVPVELSAAPAGLLTDRFFLTALSRRGHATTGPCAANEIALLSRER